MNILRPYASFLLLTVLCCAIQCQQKEAPQAEKRAPMKDGSTVTLTDAQLRNAPIEMAELSMQQIATTLKLNGKIDVPPQNLVSVSTPLGGYLKSTALLPGMKVTRGQVIAIIENPQFVQLQQDYLMAQSQYHFAELNYTRQKKLNQSQASSDKVMQQAQSEMNSQQILMSSISQQLQLVNINARSVSANNIRRSVPVYSSINGYVSRVNVNIGKYVTPSDVLFELINPTDIHLNLKVYEKDLELLKTGQRITAYSNANPNKKYAGEVLLTGKDLDGNGIADVHCHFENYDPELIPGMYMNAEAETKTSFANALPEESIVDFEGQSYVFAATGKQRWKMMPVTTGASENGFVEVLNYQAFKGKKIVTKNAYTLLMKLKNTSEEGE